jgi:shikimate kinase
MSGSEASARPLFLVGFMAAGKTAAGREIARRLRWEFVDTDERIEAEEGRSISAIFAEDGEARFREIERRVLSEVAGAARTVVATGGGAFLSDATRRLLARAGRTVWLDAPFEVVRERLAGEGPGARARPLGRSDDPVALRASFERRRAAYALAEVRVASSGARPAEVAERVLQALRQSYC